MVSVYGRHTKWTYLRAAQSTHLQVSMNYVRQNFRTRPIPTNWQIRSTRMLKASRWDALVDVVISWKSVVPARAFHPASVLSIFSAYTAMWAICTWLGNIVFNLANVQAPRPVITQPTNILTICCIVKYEAWVNVPRTSASRESRQGRKTHGYVDRLPIANGTNWGTWSQMESDETNFRGRLL